MFRKRLSEKISKLIVSLTICRSCLIILFDNNYNHQYVLVSSFHLTSSLSSSCPNVNHRATNKNKDGNKITWLLQAKRRKRDSQDDSEDVFTNWYERVDKSATPDNVFWDEMARQQRAIAADQQQQQTSSKVGSDEGINGNTMNGGFSPPSAGGGRSPSPTTSTSSTASTTQNPEAVLQSFAYAARSNNFLGDTISSSANEYTWDYDTTDDEDEDGGDGDDVIKTINEEEEAEMELQRQLLDKELDYLLSLPKEELQGDADEDEIWDLWANRDQDQCKLPFYLRTYPYGMGDITFLLKEQYQQ